MSVFIKQGFQRISHKVKPYAAMILLQFGFAGMYVISQAMLKEGMNHFVLVVYRNIIAFVVIAPFAHWFERARRPKLTSVIFLKILALVLIEPVFEQNLYYMGAKLTSASFSTAMENTIPAITYIMALLLRLEKLHVTQRAGQLKVAGTLLTFGGALLLILYKGPTLDFLWFSNGANHQAETLDESSIGDRPSSFMWLKGTLLLICCSTCWSGFLILQSNTLESYPVELTLTALVCSMGAVVSGAVALVVERGNTKLWVISWDMRLLTVIYSGVICTGVSYYVQGLVIRQKGPVFASSFTPLCTIITALMGSIFISETVSLGMTIGAIIMIGGLYSILWGQSREQLKNYEVATSKTTTITCIQVPDTMVEQDNKHERDLEVC